MTPEQKIARLSGLVARLVSLVSAADAMMGTDQNAAIALLNEAMTHSRDIRTLQAPAGREEGLTPSLAIVDGGASQPAPFQPTVEGALNAAGHTPEFSATIARVLEDFATRLTAIETKLGSNGGPPLQDPPTQLA